MASFPHSRLKQDSVAKFEGILGLPGSGKLLFHWRPSMGMVLLKSALMVTLCIQYMCKYMYKCQSSIILCTMQTPKGTKIRIFRRAQFYRWVWLRWFNSDYLTIGQKKRLLRPCAELLSWIKHDPSEVALSVSTKDATGKLYTVTWCSRACLMHISVISDSDKTQKPGTIASLDSKYVTLNRPLFKWELPINMRLIKDTNGMLVHTYTNRSVKAAILLSF